MYEIIRVGYAGLERCVDVDEDLLMNGVHWPYKEARVGACRLLNWACRYAAVRERCSRKAQPVGRWDSA